MYTNGRPQKNFQGGQFIQGSKKYKYGCFLRKNATFKKAYFASFQKQLGAIVPLAPPQKPM